MPQWDHKQNCECLKQGPHNSCEYLHILATLLSANLKTKKCCSWISFIKYLGPYTFQNRALPALDSLKLVCVCVRMHRNVGVRLWECACVSESQLSTIVRECVYTAVWDSRIKCWFRHKSIHPEVGNCGLKDSKAKAGLLSSFSSSVAVVIQLRQLLTRLGLKFTSTMR